MASPADVMRLSKWAWSCRGKIEMVPFQASEPRAVSVSSDVPNSANASRAVSSNENDPIEYQCKKRGAASGFTFACSVISIQSTKGGHNPVAEVDADADKRAIGDLGSWLGLSFLGMSGGPCLAFSLAMAVSAQYPCQLAPDGTGRAPRGSAPTRSGLPLNATAPIDLPAPAVRPSLEAPLVL